MRSRILFSIILLLSIMANNIIAQCVNGTATNPDAPLPPPSSLPFAQQFKVNTFDWLQNELPNGIVVGIPITTRTFLPGLTHVNNPFYTVNNSALYALEGGRNGKNNPSDGWELIKQDFGYAYGNNAATGRYDWRGTTILQTAGYSQNGRAYMMLYNKYRGVLRIVAIMDNGLFSAGGQVFISLSIVEKDLTVSNYANFNFNALFNRYNRQETALDKETKVATVTAPAQVPSTASEFFYADFQLSYDPCICFFESALQVTFAYKDSSTLKLTGRILGTTNDIADKNANPGAEYLTSVWNKKVPNQPYNQQYNTIATLQDDLDRRNNSFGGFLSDLSGYLVKAAKIATAVSSGGGAFAGVIASAKYEKFGKLAKAFDLFSLFSDDGKSSGPSVITAEVAAVGTIARDVNLPSHTFLIGTPGSKNVSLLPEYTTTPLGGQGAKPMYPMYNEMPGLFAVTKTPVVDIRYYNTSLLLYKLADYPLQYTFNPIVDAEKTKVFVAVEVVGGGANLSAPFTSRTISRFLPIENAHDFIQSSPFGQYIFPENYNVVFEIFYQFKPDANGIVKTKYEIVKVKPDIEGSYEDLLNDSRFRLVNNIPTNLSLTNRTLDVMLKFIFFV